MINYSGDFAPLRSRKITEETCKKFNVRQEGPALRFPYYAGAGSVVAYKERDPNKKFLGRAATRTTHCLVSTSLVVASVWSSQRAN